MVSGKPALLFECPLCYRMVMNLYPTNPHCAGINIHSLGMSMAHESVPMTLLCTIDPVIARKDINYGLMANDINEAIEKTSDEHGFDFGYRAIIRALPQFLAAVIKAQAELDQKEGE